jgi:hypothetical protein
METHDQDTRSTKPGEQPVGDDVPIENGITQPVTHLRAEANLRESD